MKSYKIYNPATGLYSKGGMRNDWTKQGKTWSHAGLKKHIAMLKSVEYIHTGEILELYKTCEIHEFEADPTVIDISTYLA